jgi:hypothetical protein
MMFQPDSATPPIAKSCVRCVEGVAGDRVASKRTWPPFSSDPNPCDFFLWDTLKDKQIAIILTETTN